MPLANIKVIEGVFTDFEKQQMIKQVAEALISVEGEQLRGYTLVTLEETKSGDWAVGGQAMTTQQVKQVRQGS